MYARSYLVFFLLWLTGCCQLASASVVLVADPKNQTHLDDVPDWQPESSALSPCSELSDQLEADLRQLREEQSNNSREQTGRLDALRQLLTYNATHSLDAVLLGKLETLERQLGESFESLQRQVVAANREREDPAVGSGLSTSSPNDVAVTNYRFLMYKLTQLRSRVESQRTDQEAQKLQLESQKLQLESQRLEMENQKLQLQNQILKVESQELQLETQKLELEKLRASQQNTPVEVGTSYIRWGRTVCGGEATTLYRGYASGSKHGERGGASNLLCLHETPQWNRTIPGIQSHTSRIHGVEYEVFDQGRAEYNNIFSNANNGGQPLLNHPAACALCHVPNRSTKIMIAARRDCPSGFTKEYNGYIMADWHDHHRSSYECWDDAPETMPGASAQNHALVYPTEIVCGSLPCSKFVNGLELTCVVCTK